MVRITADERRIRAAVTLPGSKSISNRLVLLNAVLGEDVPLRRLSESDDTVVLRQALELVQGTSTAGIDIGQAGADMRFLAAYLAARQGKWLLTGPERMQQRPVGPLVDALKQLGARVEYVNREGFPPLRIEGSQLRGGEVHMTGSVSSQFVSALLLVAPLMTQPLELHLEGATVSRPYIVMTLELMRRYGIRSSYTGNTIRVFRRSKKTLPEFEVESDWSAASYCYSVCALARDTRLELRHLSRKSLQADAVAEHLFARLGVRTIHRPSSVLLQREGAVTDFFDHDFTDCPDLAQTLAVACFGLGVPARLTGLRTLRIKETDRVNALRVELEKLGAEVTETPESLAIKGAPQSRGGETPVIETYGDHRMAMSFAPLAARYGQLRVADAGVVSKSYPAFWKDLQSLGFTVILQP